MSTELTRPEKSILIIDKTITPREFSEIAAREIRWCISGWGVDEDRLLKVLGCVADAGMGGSVREVYNDFFKRDVIQDLRDELPSGENEIKRIEQNDTKRIGQ